MQHLYTNELVNESSPYLLQHAHNPVNWKPWGDQALEQAQKEKKLIVISIGYAACHWCHVMEKESFEDSTVAKVMNDYFIAIKVDREERPDVDQTYINAVQLMTGSAGWPLNVVTLPDGRPIFGGTYFKKEQWIESLYKIQELYEQEPKKLEEYASRLEEGIKSLDLISINDNGVDFKNFNFTAVDEHWKSIIDIIDGGTRGAPKFMMPNQLLYLLRYAHTKNDKSLQNYVYKTLQKMAYGGIYDHLGGGFSRYSTDVYWHVPHFEKMLYDNAQMVSLYSQAYQLSKNPLYKNVVEETLQFVEAELSHPDGYFYSSLDADSEDEQGILTEGAFYTFTKEELNSNLTIEEYNLLSIYYNVNDYGLWEEENCYVLIKTKSPEEIAQQLQTSVQIVENNIKNIKAKLLNYRNQRQRPRLDDKTLTSWNALMIKGYVDAYKAFGNIKYLEKAKQNGAFIINQQTQKDGGLYHNFKAGKSSINGYLEDYSAVVEAFIALYEVTLDENWLQKAKQYTAYCYQHFLNEENQMFYFTSKKDKAIINRTIDYRDNVIPSSNAMMAKNLFVLSHHFDDESYRNTALQMLKNVQPEMEKYPSSFFNWWDLFLNYNTPYFEIVVAGADAIKLSQQLNSYYLPQKLLAGSTKESSLPLLQQRNISGKTFIYVCVNNACKLPVESVEEALKLLK